MRLTARKVDGSLRDLSRVKGLLERAFLKNEQFPMFLLRLRAWSSYVHFLAYYDGDDFCGFTYTVENEDMVFVLYLAVNDEIRSKGYGTAILTDLKARASGRGVALNIEPLDPHAVNSEQRERRLEFYRRNGFVSTDYNLIDGGDRYLVLCMKEDFPVEDYIRVIKRISFGLHAPKVERVK